MLGARAVTQALSLGVVGLTQVWGAQQLLRVVLCRQLLQAVLEQPQAMVHGRL